MDKGMGGFGMAMGPFALLDMLGLDVCADVSMILYDSFGPRMKAAEILGDMQKNNRLGTKNGIGFYVYDEAKKADLKPLVDAIQAKTGVKGTSFSPERLVYQMINEAAYCLEENVASPSDIDLAMLAGTGFPQDKGGPLHLADGIRGDVGLEKLKEVSNTFGARFWPAAIFHRMGAAND